MKKIIVLIIAAFTFTAGFAQSRGNQNGRNQSYPIYNNNDRYGNHANDQRDGRYDDRGYRNNRDNRGYDRRDDRYDRHRNVPAPPPVVYERPQPSNFGKGVAVGAIATIILGAILSR